MNLVQTSNENNTMLNLPELPFEYHWVVLEKEFDDGVPFLSISLQSPQFNRSKKKVVKYVSVASRVVDFFEANLCSADIEAALQLRAKEIHEDYFSVIEKLEVPPSAKFVGVYA